MDANNDNFEPELISEPGSLARRFAIAGSVVLIFGGVAIGAWVADEVETSVTRNTAAATALFMESVIAPLSQELVESDRLSIGASRALEEIFVNTPIGERVISYKIWKPDGLIVHASDADRIGRRFETSDGFAIALQGNVVAKFDELKGEEAAIERASGLPLLEIYSPIRKAWSSEIIAVAEFYEVASDLKRDIAAARRKSWFVVAGVTLVMAAALFGIVLKGSRMIDAQQAALKTRVEELARLASQNELLRKRVERASSRSAEMAERSLRRLSAELHDGPAQLMSLAALRLEHIQDAPSEDARSQEIEVVRSAVSDAMEEVRAMCRGLALPDIQTLDLRKLIDRAINEHRRRTNTDVAVRFASDFSYGDMPHPIKICIYRFLQEALWNSWRHAHGVGQAVMVEAKRAQLQVSVSDQGPGFAMAPDRQTEDDSSTSGMGLAGLRGRIESLGGELDIRSASDAGTTLLMRLTLGEESRA